MKLKLIFVVLCHMLMSYTFLSASENFGQAKISTEGDYDREIIQELDLLQNLEMLEEEAIFEANLTWVNESKVSE
jgi:hypothetical protein